MATGRNDKRRRRVILDDAVQSGGDASATAEIVRKTSVEPGKAYSDAAKRRGQLKTTDLIPKRLVPVIVVFSIASMMVAAINLLAIYSPNWSALSPDAVRALGFSGVGTISSWFSSLLFMITGMASLQIYGMRRHRCDDYDGHYRIWVLMALLFLFASINVVVDMRAIFNSLSQAVGFSNGNGNGFVVILAAKLVALTALVIRGVLEIRASRGALAAVVFVWAAYTSALVTQIPAVKNQLVRNDELILGNCLLLGTLATFFTVVIYARFVYLHANDLIKPELSMAKSKLQAKPEQQVGSKQSKLKMIAAKVSSRRSEKDLASESTRPNPAKKKESNSNQKAGVECEEILSLPVQQKLSKSDRRRQRKQEKQQRRAA